MKRTILPLVIVCLSVALWAQQRTPDAILTDIEHSTAELRDVVAPVCTYVVTPASVTVEASGGAPVFDIGTKNPCAWTVAAPDPWTTASQLSGAGLGQVTVTVAPNTATTPRTATPTIAGQRISIAQGSAPPDAGAITTGADLTKALAAKQPVITIKGILTGNFTTIAPVKIACVTPPTVGPGVRVTPAAVSACQLIAADKTQPVIWINASDFSIDGTTMTGVAPDRTVVVIGDSKETDASKLPRRITINQNAILGDSAGLGHRGIQADGGDIRITNNYIAGFLERFRQSQAILSQNGPGPFLIENNKVEASGENIMFGGADPAVLGLIPSDIVVRNNDLSKPLDQYPPNSVVNNFELKNARRVLLEGNLLDGSRVDVQTGQALTLTPRNQDGKCPWCTVEDVIVRKNVLRNFAGYAAQIGCTDNNFPSGHAKNIRFEGNLLQGVNGIVVNNGMDGDLIIVNNTLPKITGAVLTFNGPVPPVGVGAPCRPNLVFTKNVTYGGRYSINGQFGGGQGHPTITSYTSTDVRDVSKVGGNVIEESNGTTAYWGRWPGGNTLLGLGALAPLLDAEWHYTGSPAGVGW